MGLCLLLCLLWLLHLLLLHLLSLVLSLVLRLLPGSRAVPGRSVLVLVRAPGLPPAKEQVQRKLPDEHRLTQLVEQQLCRPVGIKAGLLGGQGPPAVPQHTAHSMVQ